MPKADASSAPAEGASAPRRAPTSPAVRAAEGDEAAAAGRLVEIALPVPVRQTFTYRAPAGLGRTLRRGCRVVVPFGPRLLTGFVVGFDPPQPPGELKSIRALVDREPLLDESLLELTRWIAERTLCSWGEALRAALPGHAAPRREKIVSLAAPMAADLFGELAGASLEERVLSALGNWGELPLSSLARALGMRVVDVEGEVRRLVRAGKLRVRERVAQRAPAGPPRVHVVRLTGAAAGADLSRAPVQARCVELLREAGGELPLRELAAAVAGSRPAVKRLVEKDLAEIRREIWEGHEPAEVVRVSEPELFPAQRGAVEGIVRSLRQHRHRVFLLHGVTGSGKTEVYMRAMAEARRLGRRAILLVPEITLTPQTVSRLRGRFGARAAVFHSRLSDAERRRIWHAAREGRYDVVLGPRSAIFTPLPEVGLVVIDEEHEGAYKQEEAPRYHAREVAIERARRAGAVVVLGSATPDVETYVRAERGDYELLRLPGRVSSLPLPSVKLIDLRGQRGIFSAELLEAIAARLSRREQVILFLNRRGFAPFVQCLSCGGAIRCGDCAVTLTYHKAEGVMRCHYCDREEAKPRICPACRSENLSFRGTGTQRVEEELREHFPSMRLARLDSDAVRRTGAHEEILGSFLEEKLDVLLGTQMVAKGLDFPRVTLVGVINADTGLHLPDYRSAERTFQVLAQVAGRAGRSELGGEVLIQTRCPEHPCLLAARDHDDGAFRRAEIEERRAMRYPPFARLASVLVRGPHLPVVEEAAAQLRDRIAAEVLRRPEWTVVLGPAPAPLAQLRGKHRLRLLVKGERREDVLAAASQALDPPGGLRGVEVIVDVDPMDML